MSNKYENISNKILIGIIGVLIIVIIFSLGIMVGLKISSQTSCLSSANYGVNRINGNAINQSSNLLSDKETKIISGTIQKIDGNKLTFKISSANYLSDSKADIRTVTVDSNTKINLVFEKDPAQFKKEMDAFDEKMKQLQVKNDPSQIENIPLSPSPFENKEIKLSELKENQNITVVADENIKNKKEFIAIQIDAQEIPSIVTDANVDVTSIANTIK